MSDTPPDVTNRPQDDVKIEPLGYYAAVNFHPTLRLDRQKGLEFAQKLSSVIDARGVELDDNHWSFKQPLGTHPNGMFAVAVLEGHLQVMTERSPHGLEWFEHRYEVILKEFATVFSPELALNSTAMVRGCIQISGDARTFLAEHVIGLDTNILGPLKRPLQGFGLRLVMPPFMVEKATKATGKKKPAKSQTKVVDWSVELKIESLLEDPSKLFVEANATWVRPLQWSLETVNAINQNLATVSKYLNENVMQFLLKEHKANEDE